MKYQRVLYTHTLTPELKSKLRIISYNKRRSLKENVYYVSFASDGDMKYADRISRHLRNITLKPFQSHRIFEEQRETDAKNGNRQESSAPSPGSHQLLPSSPSLLSNSCTVPVSNLVSLISISM